MLHWTDLLVMPPHVDSRSSKTLSDRPRRSDMSAVIANFSAQCLLTNTMRNLLFGLSTPDRNFKAHTDLSLQHHYNTNVHPSSEKSMKCQWRAWKFLTETICLIHLYPLQFALADVINLGLTWHFLVVITTRI